MDVKKERELGLAQRKPGDDGHLRGGSNEELDILPLLHHGQNLREEVRDVFLRVDFGELDDVLADEFARPPVADVDMPSPVGGPRRLN